MGRKPKKTTDPLLELVRQAPRRNTRESGVPLATRFLQLDAALEAVGVSPSTMWWKQKICSWLDRYEKDGVLELWGAVGRGASKSTVLYKLCILFTLHGNFQIPKGEVHYSVV